MNADENLNDLQGLDQALRQWSVKTPLPPRFREGVWQRIENLEARSGMESSNWLQRWINTVPRPKFAYAYLSALLVAGIAAGSVAAQFKTSRLDSELSMRYVHSIDPYVGDTSHP